jgi:hypothetical protein
MVNSAECTVHIKNDRLRCSAMSGVRCKPEATVSQPK